MENCYLILLLEGLSDNVYITKKSGIFAGEEILDIVQQRFHEVNDISRDEVCSYIR